MKLCYRGATYSVYDPCQPEEGIPQIGLFLQYRGVSYVRCTLPQSKAICPFAKKFQYRGITYVREVRLADPSFESTSEVYQTESLTPFLTRK
jgi:hypothetical protein